MLPSFSPLQQRPRRRGWTQHAPLAAACGASLLVGALMVWLPTMPDHVDPTDVSRLSNHGASNARNEPFSIIEPHDEPGSALVALGDRLFHDPILSADGSVSCASCHDVAAGGDDGAAFSLGIDGQRGDINAHTVLNSGFSIAQFWDGRAATLEEQVDGPIHHPKEMGSNWADALQRINEDDAYEAAFQQVFGGPATPERVRSAIATFERSLVTPGAPFDRWLMGGDDALSADALAGFQQFKDHGCVSCHQGRGLGGNLFQRLGVMREYFVESRPLRESDLGRFNHTRREEDRHVFRVPSLRNVELTAPYFHDGSAATLDEAVRTMLIYQVGVTPNASEVRQIVRFLHTLTGELPEVEL